MIYLLRPNGPTQFDTATAETSATAQRLEQRGYRRCSQIHWRAVRRRNDKRDLERIRLEDWLARQDRPAPDVPPGTVIGKTANGLTIFKG